MDRIANLFRYANVGAETYHNIADDINASNRRCVRVFSIWCFLALVALTLLTFVDPVIETYRMTYFFFACVFIILHLFTYTPFMKNNLVAYVIMYTFIGFAFIFGIVLAIALNSNQPTISFFVILVCAPLLFTDAPWRMIIAILLGSLVYLIALTFNIHEPALLDTDYVNAGMFTVVSIIASVFMMQLKCERLGLVQQNLFLSESDQLTGLMNRRSYEKHVQALREQENINGILVCAMDVNGLKAVNDALGHVAGDELLCAAAQCISDTFSRYGKCYRTGGDEFMAILMGQFPKPKELEAELQRHTDAWRGSNDTTLSISVGYVEADHDISIDELTHRADAAMYEAKAAYYARAEKDRRRK